ncbi:MAG: hypothetical protein Q8R53_05430 [Nanoarchaeota archaeon]|nr:hypothetical protein [Nanoarchaeota archaeon]
MIDAQAIAIFGVFAESIGIILAEKKTALLLSLATILTIIIFFMT